MFICIAICIKTPARKLAVAAPQHRASKTPAGKLVVAGPQHGAMRTPTRKLAVAAPPAPGNKHEQQT